MRKMLLVILSLTLSTALVFAGTTGKLAGKVTDKNSGEPLPFVNITIEGTNLGAATDLDGNYVILNIPPGNYTVKVQYIGYQTILMENVSISIDLTTTRDFELLETTVELQAIVVESESEVVKKDVTSSQSLISADQIQALPVVELNDILQLQAGVTRGADGSFHIRGGRSSEIAYWVNGVSVTDAYDNSRGIEIDNSSVQELQVISGTFNAEYGNAMSGIINTVTKEGGREFHGDIKVYSSDYFSDFTSYYPHIDDINPVANYNLQGSLSGPIPGTSDKLGFFVNARYNYDDGWLYGERRYQTTGLPDDGKVVSMDWSKRFIGQFNLSYWASQEFKFNGELLYSKEDFQDYAHDWRYVPEGNVKKYTTSYNPTLTMTHMLSSSTFYTVKGSYFYKEFQEHLYDSETDPRYLHPDSLINISYAFRTKGTNLHRFNRSTATSMGKADFTSQLDQNHLLKSGAEVRLHNLHFTDYNLQPKQTNGVEDSIFTPAIPDITSSEISLYDTRPIEISGYLQDKIEFENVIINLGLRFDYFDSKGHTVVDPTDPNIYLPVRSPREVGFDTDSWDEVPLEGQELYDYLFPYYYKDTEPKWQLSPRFGIAYPISDAGVLHFSYGHFLQIPSFQYLYNLGAYKVPQTGSNYGVYGNPDLKPQRTIMYEIGFRQEFDVFNVDVTSFYRDIRNWITAGPLVSTRNLVTYSTYINKDYSNVKGVTLTFGKRFENYYSFDINYTYQVAEGSNSTPEEEFYAQSGNNEPTLFLIPLDWDQRHLANVNFFVGAQDWGASIIARYGTGLPYTPAITQYTSDRGISSGLQRNSRRKPTQFTVDLKLNKEFDISGVTINTFLQVFNIFDAKTVVNVFGDTGQPDYTTEGQNVGYDPNRPNTVEEYLKYPDHYGEPRLIQFGLEFGF